MHGSRVQMHILEVKTNNNVKSKLLYHFFIYKLLFYLNTKFILFYFLAIVLWNRPCFLTSWPRFVLVCAIVYFNHFSFVYLGIKNLLICGVKCVSKSNKIVKIVITTRLT